MLGPSSNIHCAALEDDSAAYFAGAARRIRVVFCLISVILMKVSLLRIFGT